MQNAPADAAVKVKHSLGTQNCTTAQFGRKLVLAWDDSLKAC